MVDVHVTVSGSSTGNTFPISSGGSTTKTFSDGDYAYGVYQDYQGGSERLEKGTFTVGSSSSGGGGSEGGGDIGEYPPYLEYIDNTCDCIDWNIDNIEIICKSYDSSTKYMSMGVTITMYSSASGTTGGRVTSITLTADGISGSKSTDASANMAISRYGTNSITIPITFAWYSGNTKNFDVKVKWGTYSKLTDSNEWKMDLTCSTTFSVTAEYTGTGLLENFFWGGKVENVSQNDNFSERVTETVWKDLINKVNLLMGTSVSASGVSSGAEFKAEYFNNVAKALGLTSLGTKKSGDSIYASDFNQLSSTYRKKANIT
jgi:hypothetical protein